MPRSILIAYYTRTENTRAVAQAIQRQTGGTLSEIQPAVPYPAQYHAVLRQAQEEIKSNARPAIEIGVQDLDAHDTVFVGSPIWWGTIAPPVAAFLASVDLSGKSVIPFYTHGGGGAGRAESDIAQLCTDAILLPGLAVRGNGGAALEAQTSAWLARIGVLPPA
ncbi:MAG: flavodoxin [Anaerolineae bacterium]